MKLETNRSKLWNRSNKAQQEMKTKQKRKDKKIGKK